jgi:hypothetical protein
VVQACALPSRKRSWHWKPYLPREDIVVLVGEGESGKTTFAASVAASFTTGEPIEEGKRREPQTVLWLSGEEDASSETNAKLRAAGADLGRVVYVGLDGKGFLTTRLILPPSLHVLKEVIGREKAGLVVFDPLTSFLGDEFDPNSQAQVRRLMESLRAVAVELKVLILAILHYKKGREGPSIGWVSGSAAWTQTPRIVLSFHQESSPAPAFAMCVNKYSLGRRPPARAFQLEDTGDAARFVLGDETDLRPEDFTEGVGDAAQVLEKQTAEGWLKEELAGGEKETHATYARFQREGFSWRRWWAARKKLGVFSTKEGTQTEQITYLNLPPPKG